MIFFSENTLVIANDRGKSVSIEFADTIQCNDWLKSIKQVQVSEPKKNTNNRLRSR